MYNLSSKDVNRIIVACKHYAYNETGSEWMHDEYIRIIEKLCTYIDQNFDKDTKKPLECYINHDSWGSTPCPLDIKQPINARHSFFLSHLCAYLGYVGSPQIQLATLGAV